MATPANKRRYVFHFDINNSILMKDTAKGLSTTDNLVRIVCKSAWGKLSMKEVQTGNEEPQTETFWNLVHDQLTFTRPENPSMLANIPEGETADNIVTYQDYIDTVHPRVKLESGEWDPQVEETRKDLQQRFARPGGPGAKFKNTYEKMVKALTLPKGAREELGIGEDGTLPVDDDDDEPEEQKQGDEDDDIDPAKVAEQARIKAEKKMNATLFGEGKYHIIPSFYRLLMYMKKQKREFAVVFNTFGSELDNVVYEYNKFCAGEHPCFNGRNNTPLVKFDGSKNQKDMRIRDPSQRVYNYRLGDGINEMIQVHGKHERPENPTDQAHINMINDSDETYVLRDHLQQFQANLESLKKFGSLAVSEDYPAWKSSGFSNSRAKLLLVDEADYQTQHIFFDDNADDGDECIVDVRDIITGKKIEQRKYMDMYVVKVHPHRAILEPEYFIKKYEDADEKRDLEIQRVESGIEDEAEGATKSAGRSAMDSIEGQAGGETEWEKLQALNDPDYLMRTVLPVLYQGMRVVDLERPAAPLEYLALYLLKHQDMIKLPPKAFTVKSEETGEGETLEQQQQQQQ